MIVELQIDGDTFCNAFREQLRQALACELTEGVFDLDEGDTQPGEPYVITGYTVGKTRLRRAQNQVNVCIHTGTPNVSTPRPVKRPQLTQELVVHVSFNNALRASNTHAGADVPLTLPLVFELGMETCGDMRRLCIHYIGLEAGVSQALAAKIGQGMQSICTLLPVDQVIAKYMPANVPLLNSHLTMTDSGKCLAVRMEFWEETWSAATADPPRPLADWEQFYNGVVIDRLQRDPERDGWSIFLDERALTHFARQMVSGNMGGGLTITRQPKAVWYNWYVVQSVAANRIRVDFEVEKKDACWCFTEDIDLEAEVTADVVISVPAADTLRIDIFVDISPNGWDAACCVLTAALFWPILGLGQAVKGNVDVGVYWLLVIGGPLVSLIGAVVQINKETSKFPPPGGFVTASDDETHAYSEQKLDLPSSAGLGAMSLRGTHPVNDPVTLKSQGLYLYGGLQVTPAPQPVLEDPVLEPFCWSSGGHCSRRVVASTRFRLYPVNPQHWALLHVCDVHVLDDPLQIFKVEVTRELHSLPDVTVSVDFWAMNADYWKAPYRCQLMVKTTGGVRILTLPPLQALSEEQFKSLYLGIQLQFVNDCYLPRHRLFEELEWPIEVLIEQPGLHYWQVRAVGLTPRERVDLVDERGQTIGRFAVNANGTLLVNALGTLRTLEGRETAGARPAPIFTLRRNSGGRIPAVPGSPVRTMMDQHHAPDARHHREGELGEFSTQPICGPDASGSYEDIVKVRHTAFTDIAAQHRDPSREVMIRQTLLEDRGEIRLWGECLALSLDADHGWPRLVVVTAGVVEAYDLRDPAAPRRADTWCATGVRGATAFGRRLLLWGDRGIWTAGQRVPDLTAFSRCGESAVRAAVAGRGQLYVLRDDHVSVYGSDLCERERHACRATQIALAGDRLAVLEAEGVRFIKADGTRDESVEHRMRGVTRIGSAPLPMSGAFYARGSEGGVLLDARGERLAEWDGDAWFEGIHRTGRLLAFVEGEVVRLLEATRTRQSE
jgi:hypothetical protein